MKIFSYLPFSTSVAVQSSPSITILQPLDPEAVDLSLYPDFLKAKWSKITLNPGDCVYVPAKHNLHYVKSHGELNVAFTFLWNSDEKGCDHGKDEVKEGFLKMSESYTDVLWPYPGNLQSYWTTTTSI